MYSKTRGPRLGGGRPVGAVDELGLEGSEEALGQGVVVAVADRAHRGRDPGLAQALAEREARVLAPVVGVVDEAARRSTADDRRVKGRGDELGPQVGRHRPADDPAAPGVGDRGEVAGPGPCRERGDVGDPEPVGPSGPEVALDEVREGRRVLVADGRSHEAPAVDTREVVVLHQPGDPLARHVVPGLGEVGPDAGHAVRAAAPGMELPDLRGQGRVGALPGGGPP